MAQQPLVFQEKMTSVGTLTAGMAHEINNPVNFAHAGAQTVARELSRFHDFLLQMAGDDVDPAILIDIHKHFALLHNQVEVITEGSSRIRSVIKDLRNFSRLDESEQKTVAIVDNLRSTIQLVRTQYAGLVTIELDVNANPAIDCHPAQLNQVFMNLILNACQAITSEGRAAPGPHGRLELATAREGDQLLITLRDNGCGIPAHGMERLFEPFYTTKAAALGTGSGLSISLGIIQKHGGNVEVSSTEGQGAVFTVRLPLKTNPAGTQQTHA